ncbi:hypothetical protein JX265_009620 [Neoarthrinium moseri]|uniref:Uncharacterized protein n=1 Tax=Neoarthrinium moseri TaxID=1658444 RepID=A0A9P9WFQ9_9PEZI|nr:uncharacterized protein JN550_013522 [Neoarthrinium moseri]KAI1844117.1 hypothetical protein JX266_009790 [Neoarthrinium moseri]KAI1856991.1 hypothetical protein JN550_013522 [Neoarthrinium moseri]KAI1861001.1 hypothetical protein JX265_009620 [Neoarthrinium moseri]
MRSSTVTYVYRCGCTDTIVFDFGVSSFLNVNSPMPRETITTVLDELCFDCDSIPTFEATPPSPSPPRPPAPQPEASPGSSPKRPALRELPLNAVPTL